MAATQSLQQRAARGAVFVLSRTVLQRAVAFAAGVILARLLTPAEFGIYAVVSLVVTFFTTFSDVGFGAALIQQQYHPSREDLTTTFTAQLALTGALAIGGFFVAPFVSHFYHLGSEGIWLIRVLLASLPIGLLRAIPAILLERDLSYGRLSVVESVEALTFQSVAVVLAVLHFGVWSFIWATLARGVLGVATAWLLSPWKIGLGYSRSSAHRLLHFGIPYQLQQALAFIKDSMTPTLLSILVGAASVGYINWAFTLAAAPLAVTTSLWRVTFPAFSRAQGNEDLLRTMIERCIRLSAIVFLPMSLLMMAAGPEIVRYIYTTKWMPGLPAFYLFSVSLWTGPLIGSTFFSVFYATGNSRLALYFIILYTVLDWGVGIPLVVRLGFNGVAIQSVVVAYGTFPLLLRAANRIVRVRAIRQVTRPFAAAALAGAIEYVTLRLLPPGPLEALTALAWAGLVYAGVIAVWERDIIRLAIRRVLPPAAQSVLRWYLPAS